jgi:uncharacterized repeat protein (TIGR01451 family)
MPSNRSTLMTVLALLLVAVGAALPAAAESVPSSDLLLPWFEVHLSGQRTTLFAVGNAAGEPVDVRVSIRTNWGIPVVERIIRLEADEVQTVNLRDWLVAGNVPAPRLRGAELAHVQAALTGQPSPKDDLFYSTQADPFDPELAAGYVTLRIKGAPRPQALWGDYFWVDPEQDFAEGELLVNINKTADCGDLCDTHRMRFIEGGGFDGGTKLVIWSAKQLQPAPNANSATLRNLLSLSAFHREPGEQFDERILELLPVELVSVRDLFLAENFGWMDLASDEEIYVGVRYSANNRYSVAFQTWCIPEPPPPPPPPSEATPELDLEKLTNGQDADLPPGPNLERGDDVVWEYLVTNTGEVAIHDIQVTDDQEGAIACPKTTLQPGQSMVCTLAGKVPTASACSSIYENLGTVTGETSSGESVSDEDPSHYRVHCPAVNADIDIEKATNGHDADAAPGPSILQGGAVTWTYVVTNTGGVALTGVAVTDDKEGTITCPKTTLAVGESMTCSKNGTAGLGQYANVGSVTGTPQGGGTPVSDSDPSHYNGTAQPVPAIDIEKATNGQDADQAPGPSIQEGNAVTWTYVVTNTGQVKLNGVAVTDNLEGAITCPKSTLQPGESMTCTKNGTAQLGQYANVGSVTGTPQGGGSPVSDSDPSHYNGTPKPASIDIEKATNGHDADTGPGPELEVGQTVTWTYVVTNTGEAKLTNVTVTDDQEGAVACPKSTLQPGESMTCTENGTAVEGDYANLGTVVGKRFGDGLEVSDSDPSHYHAELPPPGDQGCTPGYWKNHTDSWPPTGYSPSQAVQSVFSAASGYPAHGSASLLQALSFEGGSTLEGGVGNLLRAAVAGLLNTAHDGVSYPRTTSALVADVNAALASGNRDTMLALASQIDQDNNLGCPLN